MAKATPLNWNALSASDADITRGIKMVHTSVETQQLRIHKILFAICVRWNKTGDVRPAVKHVAELLDENKMKGMRKNAIRAWVETYMHFTFDEATNAFVAGKDKSGKSLDLKDCENKRWWELKPEPKYVPIEDPLKLVQQLISKMEKDKKTMGEESKVSVEMLEFLRTAKTNASIVSMGGEVH